VEVINTLGWILMGVAIGYIIGIEVAIRSLSKRDR
jgi:hypothetical protein